MYTKLPYPQLKKIFWEREREKDYYIAYSKNIIQIFFKTRK